MNVHRSTEEGVEQSRQYSLYAKKPVQGSDSEPFVNSLTSFGGKNCYGVLINR